MARQTKRPDPRKRPVQHPKRRDAGSGAGGLRPFWIALGALLFAGALAGFVLIGRGGGETVTADGGLPAASDYHSLLVDPDDPNDLLLGTHDGLYRSTDGGAVGFDRLLYRTGDRGETWTPVAGGAR